VDFRSDKVHAKSGARDCGAAKSGERIHYEFDFRQSVQANALLGQTSRECGRMRPIAVAPLNSLVGDEPGVPPAAHAVGCGPPTTDVRLVLVRYAERQAIEPGVTPWCEMEHELVAIVQKSITVNWFVVTNSKVSGEACGRTG